METAPLPDYTDTAAKADRTLVEEANDILARLRDGLSQVIAAQRGGEVKKAADLHKALGLAKPLGWSLYRVATSEYPLNAGPYVPGAGPMAKFLQAAQAHGAPEELVSEVRAAFEAFERFVEDQAGDRESFESMISHPDRARREAADLRHKRNIFRSSTHVWGSQSRVVTLCNIVHPCAKPGMVDGATIHGVVGYRQVRPDLPLMTTLRWTPSPKRADGAAPIEEPIDPNGIIAGPYSFLSDYCSKPMPAFRTSTDMENYERLELIGRGVGKNGELTFFVGSVGREKMPPFPVDGKLRGYHFRLLRPTELFLWDILVHKDLWSGPPPEVRICSGDTSTPNTIEAWDADKLPVQESIAELGMGTHGLPTRHVPRYRELITHALTCLGWNANDFRVFRCAIDYPVMHSFIRINFRPNA